MSRIGAPSGNGSASLRSIIAFTAASNWLIAFRIPKLFGVGTANGIGNGLRARTTTPCRARNVAEVSWSTWPVKSVPNNVAPVISSARFIIAWSTSINAVPSAVSSAQF